MATGEAKENSWGRNDLVAVISDNYFDGNLRFIHVFE